MFSEGEFGLKGNIDAPPTETVERVSARRGLSTLAKTAGVYVLIAGLVYPADFASLLSVNFLQLESFAIPFTMLALALEGLYRDRDALTSYVISLCRKRGKKIISYHLFLVLALTAYTTYKVNIPYAVPFYADRFLSGLDIFLHGAAPWTYVHQAPQSFGIVVSFTYARLWLILLSVGCYGMVIWASEPALKRFMWALFTVYAGVGTVLATAFSSVGPIFYGDFYADDLYAPLRDAVFSNPYVGGVQYYTRYLLDNYHSTEIAFGTGISAMPSVHVATTTLIAWMLTSLSKPTAVFGWLFLVVIAFGSVYIGWHYAVDGYASFVIVSTVWILLSRRYGLPLLPRKR